MPSVGLREYARYRGCSLKAVQKAITAGRITKTPEGKIDLEEADRRWIENSDPAQVRSVVSSPTGTREIQRPPAAKHVRVPSEEVDRSTFLSARTRREVADAETAELKLGQAKGELLPKAEQRQTFERIGKIFAAGREALPAQLALKLVGKTDPADIERILRAEFRAADLRTITEIESRFGLTLGDSGANT
jgi:hypothetical protein